MRISLFLLLLLPSLALAAPGDAPPISEQTQLELLLFPLGVIIFTICLTVWHRRKRKH